MKIKNILLWFLTAVFLLLAILFITKAAGFLFLLAAVMAVPIPKLRDWIDELVVRYGKTVIVAALVIVAVLLLPKADAGDGTVQTDKGGSETVAGESTLGTGQGQQTEAASDSITEPTSQETATSETQQQTQPATEPTRPVTDPTAVPTEPTQVFTEPTQEPTEPTAAPTEPQGSAIVFVSWPQTIVRGTEGTVTIKGEPNTTYSIKVYYKSGPSSASGLEDKVSDADGYVTWTWKVSSRTGTGTFKIVVSGGGDSSQVEYSVVEQ